MSQKLRIGLMALGGRSWIGGSEYIKNIVLALNQLPQNDSKQYELVLISANSANSSQLEISLEPYLSKKITLSSRLIPKTLLERLRRKIWQKSLSFNTDFNLRELLIEEILVSEQLDFVYPFLTKFKKDQINSAAWIYDFQHKYLPDFFSQEEISQRDKDFATIAKHASTIVLSSKSAEKDFYKFFPNFSNKTEILSFKTFPSPEWYSLEPKDIQKKYHLPDRFFLISNQFWQHKNHVVVLEALKLLKAQSIEPIIVCTGYIYDYRKPEYIDNILQTIHRSGLAHQVYLLGLIPRLDQIQLMRRSLAVIQPSLFEGWSTVIEDARCLGKHIIMSDLDVNIEQNPPNHKLFERYSPESLANIMTNWWESLQPGLDKQQEDEARNNNLVEVQKFGHRFLEIAQNIQ